MGQLFMMGFDGTTVMPEIRHLIEHHHLGSILLTAKNLKCTCHVSLVFKRQEAIDYQAKSEQLLQRQQNWCLTFRRLHTKRATRSLWL